MFVSYDVSLSHAQLLLVMTLFVFNRTMVPFHKMDGFSLSTVNIME